MKKATLKLTAIALLMGSAVIVKAQTTTPINVVTTAVPFLRISPDARAGGMGDLGIATTADANSSFWNQAKIPFAESKAAIGVTYSPWLQGLQLNDIYLASLAGYYKLDDQQAISASLRYFSLGSIQFTDALGNDLSLFRPKEFAFDLGYSRKLSNKLALGIALRYINSNLAGSNTYNGQSYKAGNSVAADLSVFHDGTAGKTNASGLNWGVVLSNLGAKISYTNDATQKDYIPANLGIGIAYVKQIDPTNKITFAVDLNKLLVPTPPTLSTSGSGGGGTAADSAALLNYHSQGVVSSWFKSFSDAPGGFSEEIREVTVAGGIEYMYNNQFALRGGYFYEDATKGNRKYFTLGAGLNYNMFGLNFSYLIPAQGGINQNPLAKTLRFSLIFNLDKSTDAKKTK